MKRAILFFGLLCFFNFHFVFSQIEQESIDIEKSYNPSVQQAKKLQERPSENSVEKKKLKIYYSPVNVPVKSDYKLSAINPIKLPKKDNPAVYNSYLKGGMGLPLTTLLDAYVDYNYLENRHFGVFIHHFGTDTNVKKARVNDNQSQNNLALFYKANYNTFSTKLTAGYDRSRYHYYGTGDLQKIFKQVKADEIYSTAKVKNDYQTFYINAGLDSYKKPFLNNSDLLLRYFKGDFGAKEFYGRLSTELAHNTKRHSIPLNSIYFKGNAGLNLEYINTDFNTSTFDSDKKAGFFKASLTPMLTISNDINYIKLGVNVTYNDDYRNNNHKIRLYPNVEAGIKAADEFNVYVGINGQLKNNNYYDLVQNNPWLSPGVSLKTTNTRYNIYGGLRGVFSDVFQYKGEVSYADIKNFLLMTNVPVEMSLASTMPGYLLENSFGVVYHNAKNLTVKGELNYVGIKHLTTTLTGAFYNYDLQGSKYAWNYPTFTSALTTEYKLLDDKLTLGTDIYYVGERKDINYKYSLVNSQPNGRIVLNRYIDANLRGSYHINDKWGAFVKLNNLFGTYERFKNYYTQGFQVLGGFTYKFSVNNR